MNAPRKGGYLAEGRHRFANRAGATVAEFKRNDEELFADHHYPTYVRFDHELRTNEERFAITVDSDECDPTAEPLTAANPYPAVDIVVWKVRWGIRRGSRAARSEPAWCGERLLTIGFRGPVYRKNGDEWELAIGAVIACRAGWLS